MLILTLTLTSCGLFQREKQIKISTVPAEKPSLILPSVEEMNLAEIKWMVVTEANFSTVVQYLNDSKMDVVIFGLTDEGYESLSQNTSDIMQLVQQQQSIIAAYKLYYESAEGIIDAFNQSLTNDIERINAQETSKWRLFGK